MTDTGGKQAAGKVQRAVSAGFKLHRQRLISQRLFFFAVLASAAAGGACRTVASVPRTISLQLAERARLHAAGTILLSVAVQVCSMAVREVIWRHGRRSSGGGAAPWRRRQRRQGAELLLKARAPLLMRGAH